MVFGETGREGVDQIQLSQYRNQWLAALNMLINFVVSNRTENLTS